MGEIPRHLCSCILFSSLLWLSPASAARSDAEEFAAPLQAAPTASTAPQRSVSRARMVKNAATGEMAFHAKTAQGAIAAAISQRAAGCQLISFGGTGLGWVATGVANYAATDNPVATRRSQREARFKAFAIGDVEKNTVEHDGTVGARAGFRPAEKPFAAARSTDLEFPLP